MPRRRGSGGAIEGGVIRLETAWGTFPWALAGGLAAEALRWWRLVRNQRAGATINLPAYVRNPYYWALTAVIVLAGGILAVAYAASGQQLGPILAFNIGASAPLVIQGLAANAPRVVGVGDGETPAASPRNFLGGK